jgi:hypothetical protein
MRPGLASYISPCPTLLALIGHETGHFAQRLGADTRGSVMGRSRTGAQLACYLSQHNITHRHPKQVYRRIALSEESVYISSAIMHAGTRQGRSASPFQLTTGSRLCERQ